MKIFLTGVTGFVGSHLTHELLSRGHHVVGLVRRGSDLKVEGLIESLGDEIFTRFETVEGDVTEPGALGPELFEGCDAVVHLVGIIRAFPDRGITFKRVHVLGSQHTVDAVKESGITRFIHMSALGSRPNAQTAYHRTKFEAEQYVWSSDLDWTIFRPSLIVGPGGEFIGMLESMIRKFVVPMIGTGRKKFQPVSVRSLCEGIASCLENSETVHKSYDVGGLEVLTYSEMLSTLSRVLGRPIVKLPQPVTMLKPIASVMQNFEFFPLTVDQITMFLEGSVCSDTESFYKAFDVTPITFEENLRSFLNTR